MCMKRSSDDATDATVASLHDQPKIATIHDFSPGEGVSHRKSTS